MGIKELKCAVFPLSLSGHYLIGSDGDGLDLLLFAGVFADLIRGEARAAQQLVAPLAASYCVGDEDEGGGLGLGHGGRTHDGLTCATGQNDDAGAARPEGLGGVLLIIAQLPVHFIGT